MSFMKWLKNPSKISSNNYKEVQSDSENDGALFEKIELMFLEHKIGIHLKDIDDRITVVKVNDSSEACERKVKAGDILWKVNNVCVQKSSSAHRMIEANERPLCLTLKRKINIEEVESSEKIKNDSNVNKKFPKKNLSEEEKREQRLAALEAAENRKNEWDNKLKRNKQKFKNDQALKQSEESSNEINPITSKVIDECKNKEKETAQKLGYDPYKAKFLNHNEARNFAVDEENPMDDIFSIKDEEKEEAMEYLESIDLGFSSIISYGDRSSSITTFETIEKLLVNMSLKKEEKFRKIRLANPGFSNKVGSVPGGLDILLLAGFELMADDDDSFIYYCLDLEPVPLRIRAVLSRLNATKKILQES